MRPDRAVLIGIRIVGGVIGRTNTIKYAFPGDSGGTVRVDVSSDGEFLHIVVSDDGVGCPDGVEGLGSKLIRMFAKRMDGEVTRDPGETGCRVKVSVKLD